MTIKDSRILVTGGAGFIGYHLSRRFCDLGALVTGIDNLNDYYDVGLKKSRLAMLERLESFAQSISMNVLLVCQISSPFIHSLDLILSLL